MTQDQKRRCMRLLTQAKQGDELACDQLTKELSQHFGFMIAHLFSQDPAFDKDDLTLQFQLGIWQAIQSVDDRGDPLYHLAWKGRNEVISMLRAIKVRLVESLDETHANCAAMIDLHGDFMDREERKLSYVNMREILDEAHLTEKQRIVADWMLSAEAERIGSQTELASELNVSCQYISHLKKRVIEELVGAAESLFRILCLECHNRGSLVPVERLEGEWVCPVHQTEGHVKLELRG